MVIEASVVSTICTIFMRCKSSVATGKMKYVCTDRGKSWTAAGGAELGIADETI